MLPALTITCSIGAFNVKMTIKQALQADRISINGRGRCASDRVDERWTRLLVARRLFHRERTVPRAQRRQNVVRERIRLEQSRSRVVHRITARRRLLLLGESRREMGR